jgi:cell division protein FtsB
MARNQQRATSYQQPATSNQAMFPSFRKSSSRLKSPSGRQSYAIQTGRSKLRLMMWALFGVLIYVGYSYLGGSYGLIQLWRLNQRRAALDREVMRLQVQQDSLRREIQLLQTDTTYIEKLARERYKMGKPGEKIYTIVKPQQP